MLYTLNQYNVTCQLYPSKTRKKDLQLQKLKKPMYICYLTSLYLHTCYLYFSFISNSLFFFAILSSVFSRAGSLLLFLKITFTSEMIFLENTSQCHLLLLSQSSLLWTKASLFWSHVLKFTQPSEFFVVHDYHLFLVNFLLVSLFHLPFVSLVLRLPLLLLKQSIYIGLVLFIFYCTLL